jgi:2',3'-cyclic-nucleotide 2'-phosphodiesterase (5'-nucleotidase family)
MRIHALGLITALALAVLCCALPALAEELKLGVLYVNDTHGHLLPFRIHGESDWGGYARLHAAIQRQRADDGYFWLTLHAGDAFQGTPLSNMFKGLLDIECLNQTGCDAMCLGNHEFDFGYANLCEQMASARFPVLCANAYDRQRGTPVATPYVILERGGYKIGIIGLVTETLVLETDPRIAERVEVYQVLPVARQLAGYLRSTGCDVVVVLSHQGFTHDVELARLVPEVDIIVGGHSHTILDAPMEIDHGDGRRALVVQDGCYGDKLGVLKLTFVRQDPSARFQLGGYEAEYIPLKPSEPEDGELLAFLERYEHNLHAELGHTTHSRRDIAESILRWMQRYLSGETPW